MKNPKTTTAYAANANACKDGAPIEGRDYFVRYVEFPNQAAGGCAVSNGDGTFTIYLNSRCTEERQASTLLDAIELLASASALVSTHQASTLLDAIELLTHNEFYLEP